MILYNNWQCYVLGLVIFRDCIPASPVSSCSLLPSSFTRKTSASRRPPGIVYASFLPWCHQSSSLIRQDQSPPWRHRWRHIRKTTSQQCLIWLCCNRTAKLVWFSSGKKEANPCHGWGSMVVKVFATGPFLPLRAFPTFGIIANYVFFTQI